MKKSMIIGGFLCLLGLLLSAFALGMSNWNIENISTRPKLEEKNLRLPNRGQDISIQDQDKPIYIGRSPDADIHLTYFESARVHYSIADESALQIKEERKYRWSDYILVLDLQAPTLTLLLPADFQGSLTIESPNGRIQLTEVSLRSLHLEARNAPLLLEDVQLQEGARLSTSNGKIELHALRLGAALDCSTSNANVLLEDVESASVKLQSSNGKLRGKDLRIAGDVELKTKNAAIDLSALDAKGSLVCETSNSPVTLEALRATALSVRSDNGKLYSRALEISGAVTMHTSHSGIEFIDLRAEGDLSLRSANGKISGTLLASEQDFTISAHTTNAKSSLPSQFGSGKQRLAVETSNAEIDVRFSGK